MVKMEPLTQWKPQDIGNIENERQQICTSTTLLPHVLNLVLKLCMVGQERLLMKTTNGTKYNIYVKNHNSEIHYTACLLLCMYLYVLYGLEDVCLGACSVYYLCEGARGQLWRSFRKCCLS